MQITRRAGFSLIEALVVLAIGGMALAVIFSIGIKAGDTGFALGRKAVSAADADMAVSDLRVILRSLELRPGNYFVPEVDRPLTGSDQRIEGPAVMQQATTCAPQGWSGYLVLNIEPSDDGYRLVCQAGSRQTPLMSWTGAQPPRFEFSTDGQSWQGQYESPTAPRLDVELVPEDVVLIRLAAPRTDVVERLGSGRAEHWRRPDEEA